MRHSPPRAGSVGSAGGSGAATWSAVTGLSCSISTRAGNRSRTSPARPGRRSAYSVTDGRSPRRYRATNSSASLSIGSRSADESVMAGAPGPAWGAATSVPARRGRESTGKPARWMERMRPADPELARGRFREVELLARRSDQPAPVRHPALLKPGEVTDARRQWREPTTDYEPKLPSGVGARRAAGIRPASRITLTSRPVLDRPAPRKRGVSRAAQTARCTGRSAGPRVRRLEPHAADQPGCPPSAARVVARYTRLGRPELRQASHTLNSTSLGTVWNAATTLAFGIILPSSSAPDGVWATASPVMSSFIGRDSGHDHIARQVARLAQHVLDPRPAYGQQAVVASWAASRGVAARA